MNLSELLHDAVGGIEPEDRIDEIRERVASPSRAARPWWYAAGGVVLATAAAVTAFAVLGDDGGTEREHHHVATAPETFLVPAYFLGDTPRGERLFRELDEVTGSDALQAALDRIERPAADPDYRTPWTSTSFGEVMVMDGVIHVELRDADLGDDLAVQQVVRTLQGALQEPLPVRIGEATYEARPELDVLSHVSISDPTEGAAYQGALVARGRAWSYEATVPWAIRDEDGTVVREGSAQARTSDRMSPWEVRIDLAGLPAGFYTFAARTDDPTGGAEGPGPDVDTRTIIVR